MTDEVKQHFAGKWSLEKSENFEDFLKEVGVNFFLRKLAARGTPVQTITVDEDKIGIATATAFHTQSDAFKLGQEFEEERQGMKMKVLPKWEDNKLIMEKFPIDSPVKPHKVFREKVGETMLMTIEIGNVICKRWFKKLED
ncbi:hypothetical protein ScPMuIL_005518 [Solemya velum]